MKIRPRTSAGRMIERPRLYLITPLLDDPAPFIGALEVALSAGDVAAVLARLADADERMLINRAKSIAAVVQRRDIALVLEGRPELAARADADGAHLTGIAAFTAALASLKPDRIAGCGGLRSRHDAMLAGESGADYVMFGEPTTSANPTRDHGERRPRFAALVERVEWWAELVEVPCVGYAAGRDDVAPLARAGADFIALGDWLWNDAHGPAAAVAAANAALAAISSTVGRSGL